MNSTNIKKKCWVWLLCTLGMVVSCFLFGEQASLQLAAFVGIVILLQTAIWVLSSQKFAAIYTSLRLRYLGLVLLPVFGFTLLEISNLNAFASLSGKALFKNLFLATLGVLVFWCIIGRIGIATIAFGTTVFLISLVNHFTLIFRGTPAALSDIRSAKTAANVLGAYGLSITPQLVFLVLAQIAIVCLGMQIHATERTAPKASKKWAYLARAVVLAGVVVLYNTVNTAGKPEYAWKVEYYNSGYLVTTLDRAKKMNPRRPEGYSAQQVQKIADGLQPETAARQSRPDIVLIVNESWYDLSLLTQYETDVEAMPFVSSLTNTIRGYTANPILSTSNSEYEILTSNSTMLMPASIPFTQFSMAGANSIVNVLNGLGYSTFGWHPSLAQNYFRHQVYPYLGFDKSLFLEDVEKDRYYYHRWFVSDESSFAILRDEYEARAKDQPAFLYNLTMQNHGGYTLQSEEVTVHVTKGLEDCRDEAEEYLTCLQQTDIAFQRLIEYFAQQENDVILCMVGDHAPSFAYGLKAPEGESPEDWHTKQIATPFVIWANFPLEEQNIGFTSMPYLVPLLLEYADMPLTQYYQFLLDMYQEIPILGRTFYVGKDGKTYSYEDSSDYSDWIRDYSYLEYNNLTKKDRIQSIFSAP